MEGIWHKILLNLQRDNHEKSEKRLRNLELKMVELLNQEREKSNLIPLFFNEEVAEVARNHSKDMASRGFYSHVNPDGENLLLRLGKAGVGYNLCGENTAKDFSVEKAHQSLMSSHGHRMNILNPRFTDVGIGIAEAQDGTSLFITQNFISIEANTKKSFLPLCLGGYFWWGILNRNLQVGYW